MMNREGLNKRYTLKILGITGAAGLVAACFSSPKPVEPAPTLPAQASCPTPAAIDNGFSVIDLDIDVHLSPREPWNPNSPLARNLDKVGRLLPGLADVDPTGILKGTELASSFPSNMGVETWPVIHHEWDVKLPLADRDFLNTFGEEVKRLVSDYPGVVLDFEGENRDVGQMFEVVRTIKEKNPNKNIGLDIYANATEWGGPNSKNINMLYAMTYGQSGVEWGNQMDQATLDHPDAYQGISWQEKELANLEKAGISPNNLSLGISTGGLKWTRDGTTWQREEVNRSEIMGNMGKGDYSYVETTTYGDVRERRLENTAGDTQYRFLDSDGQDLLARGKMAKGLGLNSLFVWHGNEIPEGWFSVMRKVR